MLRINLIRDRAQRPPTVAERLAWLPVVCLVVLYGGGGWLIFATYQQAAQSVQVLEEATQAKESKAQAWKKRHSYNATDPRRIHLLAQVIRLYQKRWEWTDKLEAIGSALPDGTRLRRVEGEAGKEIVIRGTVMRPRRARGKIRAFKEGLEESSTFMRGLEEVRWPSIERKEGTTYFKLHGLAAEKQ